MKTSKILQWKRIVMTSVTIGVLGWDTHLPRLSSVKEQRSSFRSKNYRTRYAFLLSRNFPPELGRTWALLCPSAPTGTNETVKLGKTFARVMALGWAAVWGPAPVGRYGDTKSTRTDGCRKAS